MINSVGGFTEREMRRTARCGASWTFSHFRYETSVSKDECGHPDSIVPQCQGDGGEYLDNLSLSYLAPQHNSSLNVSEYFFRYEKQSLNIFYNYA